MTVLVDTSVWIPFLAGRAPFVAQLDSLLSRDEVVGHELVYGELLIDDKGGRRTLLAMYQQIQQAVPARHADVVALVTGRRLFGRGVGWIDMHLLASAIVEGLRLWTADPRFAELARELDVAYDVTAAS